MGRGESEFKIDEVMRVGFDADLPDLSVAIERRAIKQLEELADFFVQRRLDGDDDIRLTPELERYFKSETLRRKLIEYPLHIEASNVYLQLIRLAVVGDQPEGMQAYFKRAANRIGLNPIMTAHISLSYNDEGNLICHLRQGDGHPALCGADLSSPEAAAWRGRGSFHSAAANGVHCLNCLARMTELEADDPTRLAAEEQGYQVASDEEVGEFYTAIRENMHDILADNPDDADHFLAVLGERADIRGRAVNWMRRHMAKRLLDLPAKQRFESVFRLYEDRNFGMPSARQREEIEALISEIQKNYGDDPSSYPWPEEHVLQAVTGLACETADSLPSGIDRLLFLAALSATAWPKAATARWRKLTSAPVSGNDISRYVDALQLYQDMTVD